MKTSSIAVETSRSISQSDSIVRQTNKRSFLSDTTMNNIHIFNDIVSDVSDHFSQFCVLKSSHVSPKPSNRKTRDWSHFSHDQFINDLSLVEWSEILRSRGDDVYHVFSTFYSKFNKILNKHAPIKILSKRRIKQLSKPCQTSKKQLNKLLILQKRALRFIHFANLRDHAIPLFINTNILPVNFLYYQLLAEAMFDVSNNVVPTNIQELFLPLSRVHSYNTRSSKSQNFT